MPSMAERMLMPARIMTASWLVKFCTSLRPGRSEMEKLSFPLRPTAFSGRQREDVFARGRGAASRPAARSAAWNDARRDLAAGR